MSDQTKCCPICNEKYQGHPVDCAFCKTLLNSQTFSLGEASTEDINKYQEEIKQKRRNFIHAAVIASFMAGEFDDARFRQFTRDGITNIDQVVEEHNKKFEEKFGKSLKEFQELINRVGSEPAQPVWFINIGYEHLTVVKVSIDPDKDEFADMHDKLSLQDLFQFHQNTLSRQALALAAGYVKQNNDFKEKISNISIDGQSVGDLEKQIYICTSAFDSMHSQDIFTSLEDLAANDDIMIWKGAQDFLSFLRSLYELAELPFSIDLLLASVDSNGIVNYFYEKLFPARETGFSRDICLNLTSKRLDNGEIYFVVGKKDKIKTIGTWKATGFIPDRQKEVRFKLTGRNQVEITADGINLTQDTADPKKIIENIPEQINVNKVELDLVFLLDLIISQQMFEDHQKVVKNILHRVIQSAGTAQIRYRVVGYRDYENGKYSTNYYPNDYVAIHQGAWLNSDDPVNWGQIQLDPAKRDFESALDEALNFLLQDNFNWRRTAKKAVIAIGHRPPYPHTVSGKYQSASRFNWEDDVKQIHANVDYCAAFVSQLYWQGSVLPEHAVEYADKFWQTFTQKPGAEYCRLPGAAIDSVVNALAGMIGVSTLPLTLPVFATQP
ncbi:MAG TPA: hypothetical protein PLA02_10020 [Brevefilum fermentans]|jgi:hypothetical protein|nr:hypothetical protein [Chloroflexota bacterium]HQA29534.1 hypothetical protein [Brevefilum fermentans]